MPDDSLPPELQAKALRLRDDFAFFARNCLVIVDKNGSLVPFVMNRGQQYLHDKLEGQLKTRGKVRAIIVKGRQMGISTYLQGRFYWRLWRCKKGKTLKAFILTHDDPATANLFNMAKRFHENMPAFVKPQTAAANEKELKFADTGCGYKVATAGGKAVGRSDTIQLFHGSEVPSWPNAEEHVTSLLSTAVADVPESEAILEATAKGVGNVFHRYCMSAVRKESEYEAIFIPWFWDAAYQTDCPSTFKPPQAWLEYAQLHSLTWEQLYWAYNKNRGLAQAKSLTDEKPCPDFMQEFPATFDEAFQSSGNSFIPATSVLRARRPETVIIGRGPIILGVDPSRSVDKVGIIDRCGRRMGERICERMEPGGNLMYVAGQIARIIDRIRPDAVNIDVGGIGAGVFDALQEMGYGYCINAVNFGSRPIGRGPTGDDLYFNRRAEMHDLLRDWFETEGGVQIPDDDGLHADLTAAEWGAGACRYSSSNELIIEEKSKIKERLGASPDLGDAAALCFAVPFAQGMVANNQPAPFRKRAKRTGY